MRCGCESMPCKRGSRPHSCGNANTAWFICSVLNTLRLHEKVEILDRQAGHCKGTYFFWSSWVYHVFGE